MIEELEKARGQRDEAFEKLIEHLAKVTKHNVESAKYRKLYTIARDEVRALERDLSAYPSLV